MSILLDKQETNILRNGDNPRLERRVQPRKILSLPYILYRAYRGDVAACVHRVFIIDARFSSTAVSN